MTLLRTIILSCYFLCNISCNNQPAEAENPQLTTEVSNTESTTSNCKWDNGTKVYADSCLYAISMYSGGGPYPDSCTYCLGFTGGIKNKMAELNQIKLTPNPVNNIVTVNSNSELSLITICNSLGYCFILF